MLSTTAVTSHTSQDHWMKACAHYKAKQVRLQILQLQKLLFYYIVWVGGEDIRTGIAGSV